MDVDCEMLHWKEVATTKIHVFGVSSSILIDTPCLSLPFLQILHGVATFTIMAYFCEVGVPEIIVPMLMMEVSYGAE